MFKCAIFADFLDFENGCCCLNTIACWRRKITQVSCILFKNIYPFIGLITSLSYIRMVMEEKYLEIC